MRAEDAESASAGLARPLMEASARQRAVKTQADERRALGKRLYTLGILLRTLTLLNGVGTICAVAYAGYLSANIVAAASDAAASRALAADDEPLTNTFHSKLTQQIDEQANSLRHSLPLNDPARNAVQYLIAAAGGGLLCLLEFFTWSAERATRDAIGLAFGAGGRLALFVAAASTCVPILEWERSLLEFYATGACLLLTLANGLVQAWLLCCFPSYRYNIVSELVRDGLSLDCTTFPQVYQRDEGAHLHLGVLLPGFSQQDHVTMTVNTSELQLIGEIAQIDGPFGDAIDRANSVAGPFGAFERSVRLEHPVDCSTPVEAAVKHGIVEFKFMKGYAPPRVRT